MKLSRSARNLRSVGSFRGMRRCWVAPARRVAMCSGTVFVCLALLSCGVPTQDTALPLASEVIAQPAVPALPSPSPTGSTAPTTPLQPSEPANPLVDLWFASDTGLVPVPTNVIPADSEQAIIAGLVAGPPENEQLRTVVVDPLTGNPLVSVFEGDPTVINPGASVFIALAPEFAALPPNEQVLVLGQVVISVSGAGLGAVEFVDTTGSPVAVPLPDGRLLDRPATTSDYFFLAAR